MRWLAFRNLLLILVYFSQPENSKKNLVLQKLAKTYFIDTHGRPAPLRTEREEEWTVVGGRKVLKGRGN